MTTHWLPQPENGVYYLTPPKAPFEAEYLAVRTKENRVPVDDLVRKLPFVPSSHPHFREWQLRSDTLFRFQKYLKQLPQQHILDIGCGNGWFSYRMSQCGHTITGMDIGKTELEQAARCFPGELLRFICCDDWNLLPEAAFDLITFNASIQYFELTPTFWNSLYRLLKPGGEIHILDSPFYKPEELNAARKRSEDYFRHMQQPDAQTYYYHSLFQQLPESTRILYRPNKWLRKIWWNRSPFCWIVVRKEG